jgi:hypothetical protein
VPPTTTTLPLAIALSFLLETARSAGATGRAVG